MIGFVCDINGQPLRCGLSRSDDAILLSTYDLAAINGEAKLHKIVTRGHREPGTTPHPPLAQRGRLSYVSAPTTRASQVHADTLATGHQQLMLVPLVSIVDHVALFARVHDYAVLRRVLSDYQAHIISECDNQIGLLFTTGRPDDTLEGEETQDWITYRSNLGLRRWRRPTSLIAR